MGHRTNDWVLKSRLKYAVLNKETLTIRVYHLQKSVADLFNVSRRTIKRNLDEYKTYQNDKYVVYIVSDVP